MKPQPLFLSIAVCLAAAAFAQTNITPAEDRRIDQATGEEVGVAGRDGITVSGTDLIVTRNGRSEKLERDLTLDNGTHVGLDGNIRLRDGRVITLGAEQTLTFDGRVLRTPRITNVSPNAAIVIQTEQTNAGAGSTGNTVSASGVPTTTGGGAITNQNGGGNSGFFFDNGGGVGFNGVLSPVVAGDGVTVTTDPTTGQQIFTGMNPQTGQTVSTTTDPRTGQTVTTTTDPRTGARVAQSQDPSTGLPITTVTDPRTGRSTSTTTNPSTGQTMPVQRNPQTGQSPVPPSARVPQGTQNGTQNERQGVGNGGTLQSGNLKQPGATTQRGTTNQQGTNGQPNTVQPGTNQQDATQQGTRSGGTSGGTSRSNGTSGGSSGAGTGTSGGSGAGTSGQSGGGAKR